MSEQENLMPLVGSVMPSQPEPVLAVESEPVKAEPKKEKKEPVLKSEGNKIIYLSALKVNAYEGNSESVKLQDWLFLFLLWLCLYWL